MNFMFPTVAASNALAPRTSGEARLWAAIELLSVVALLEIGIWQLCGPLDNLFRFASPLLVAVVAWRSHLRRRLAASANVRNATRDTAQQAWGKAAVVTLILALFVHLLSAVLRFDGEGFRWFWMEKGTRGLLEYLLSKGAFIVMQQWLLHYFLAPCCAEIIPHRSAARACAAIIFGVVHLPSLLLVAMTTVAGFCWLGLFARGRRIAPLVASHLILAVLAHAALPERLTLNMRVGSAAQLVAARYQPLNSGPFVEPVRQLCSDQYFAACGGSNDAFVRGLYRDLLGRSQRPSDGEVAAWRLKLAAHARADLVVEFMSSREFVERTQAHGSANVASQIDTRLANLRRRGPSDETIWR